jgi:hypothetical protein
MASEREVVRAIADLPTEDGRITPEQAAYIGGLFEGDGSLFRRLDEQPGLYISSYYHGVSGDYTYGPWHWKLRQARNNHNEFWDALSK